MRKPWLWLPPKMAHDIMPWALPLAATFSKKNKNHLKPFEWRGLKFENPLGIAGGVDKSGKTLLSWQKLGCGFLEVGTVTPLAQAANPGKILDRSLTHQAVWNKMGFPNDGAQSLKNRLQKIRPQLNIPLFINVGKNRQTENDHAHLDYIKAIDVLKDFADAFVINISSPNTSGLRELSNQDYLSAFIGPIVEHKNRHLTKAPLLMKLSPDMHSSELESVLETSLRLGIDGWILTNTTASRPIEGLFPKDGGMSGEPLKVKSLENLNAAIKYLGANKGDRLVISVGGVSTAEDVNTRLKMGADLVQLYSALIFQGPWLFQKLTRELSLFKAN